jgi:transposase
VQSRACHQLDKLETIGQQKNEKRPETTMTTRRYALREDQWERLKDLLPGREGHVGVTAKDNRLFIEAVLYRYRAGIPWRDLPTRFGDFRVVHTRLSRWSKRGVWKRVFQQLAADADNEYAMIDATIVRAHQHSAGAKGGSQSKRRLVAAKAD